MDEIKKKFKDLLKKGAIKRIFGPYDVRDQPVETKEAVLKWQEGALPTNIDRVKAALAIKKTTTPSQKARLLNKLAAKTKVRRNLETNQREYLLHRGVGHEEKARTDQLSTINHGSVSSWTPNYGTAYGFALDYQSPKDRAVGLKEAHNRVLSAWVPESKIVGAPRMLSLGESEMAHEHEVFVDSFHRSQKAKPEELSEAKAETPSSGVKPLKTLNDRLSALRAQKVSKSLEDGIKSKLGMLQKSFSEDDTNDKKSREFGDVQLDATKHADPIYANHNTDLYHGLNPNVNLHTPKEGTLSAKYLRILGDGQKAVSIIKPAADHVDLKVAPNEDPKDNPVFNKHQSYFFDPNFTSAHRDAAFHTLATNVFGLGRFVPRATVFRHPSNGHPWSAQEFVPNKGSLGELPSTFKRFDGDTSIHKLAIMDSILGNHDRNSGNVLVDNNDKIKLIDNSLSFDYSHKVGGDTVKAPAYATLFRHDTVPPEVHSWINKLDTKKLTDLLVSARAPSAVVESAAKRMSEAKRWSKLVTANPHWNGDLHGALMAIQSHRLQKPGDLHPAEWLHGAYEYIKGNSGKNTSQSVNDDKTRIT